MSVQDFIGIIHNKWLVQIPGGYGKFVFIASFEQNASGILLNNVSSSDPCIINFKPDIL